MLTQNLLSQERKLKLRWFVALSTMPLLGVVTAFGLMPQSDLGLDPSRFVTEEIALPKAAPEANTVASFWRNERVQRGDTVVELLRRLNVDDAAASAWLRTSPEAESFRQLAVGREVQAETDVGGGLIALRYLDGNSAQVMIEKQGDGYTASTLPAQLEKRLFVRTGEINSNLYAATDAAEMPEAAAYQLSEIFSGDIDFHHDLRQGDKFTVMYETTYSNGALINTGHIQAAEFVNQGQVYRAVHFRGDYYTPEGKSVRKAFLRSPIEFSRVSSGFTNSRFHPVLNKWRAHRGVDFAAPIGTKVKATSDGTVSSFGKQAGYGNFVTISHQGRFATVYGHLSRFAKGLRRGQRVAQGDVIGYVGMTGLTTGPHLHYEFRVDGQQRDPLRIALPDAQPVSTANIAAFQQTADNFVARLNLLRNTNLAKLD
ncbi:MAG: peptidase M23 [Gallionellales bacterium RIFCSPLOWO2_12_FULL_59_22]|nr:MAG: peptidase M23 [Gallionellales bacterium RIFCSPLOWO2_02_FULL_59_110]OGT11652.1 MAG: peptidase M23 [Gallionellales bacterium RIFCSPLOWO2_12_FULL_59_22]